MKEISVTQVISSLAKPVLGTFPESGRVAGNSKKGERLTQGPEESQAVSLAPGKQANPVDVEDTVNSLNQQLAVSNRSIRFHVDEKTDILVVSVVDDDTGETIRQLPPEVTIKLAEYREGLSGLLANVQG